MLSQLLHQYETVADPIFWNIPRPRFYLQHRYLKRLSLRPHSLRNIVIAFHVLKVSLALFVSGFLYPHQLLSREALLNRNRQSNVRYLLDPAPVKEHHH